MTRRLSGKEVNLFLQEQLCPRIARLEEGGTTPTLAMVRVGADGPNLSYERGASKRLNELGVVLCPVVLNAEIGQKELEKRLGALSEDRAIHGILLLLPQKNNYNEALLHQRIAPKKDIDGARLDSLGKILAYDADGYVNCAIGAILEFIDYYGIALYGKRVCLLGAGRLIGRPLSILLLQRKATVTVCNTATPESEKIARHADILIGAAGVPGLIDERYVQRGQIVIDTGTQYVDGKLRGDLNVAAAEGIIEAYTPTPGGIGSITTTILAKHVVEAAERQQGSRNE